MVPAESISNSSPRPRFSTAARNTASAVGLLQMFPALGGYQFKFFAYAFCRQGAKELSDMKQGVI
jgi:hypothetical protein